MAKNNESRKLKIYMDTHTIPMYLPTKFHVNWPQNKGVRARVCCSPLREKYIFGNMAKNIASGDLQKNMESLDTIMYLYTKFHVNRSFRLEGVH